MSGAYPPQFLVLWSSACEYCKFLDVLGFWEKQWNCSLSAFQSSKTRLSFCWRNPSRFVITWDWICCLPAGQSLRWSKNRNVSMHYAGCPYLALLRFGTFSTRERKVGWDLKMCGSGLCVFSPLREAFPMVLVANKVDLVHLRKVNSEQGQEMAAKHNVSMRLLSEL